MKKEFELHSIEHQKELNSDTSEALSDDYEMKLEPEGRRHSMQLENTPTAKRARLLRRLERADVPRDLEIKGKINFVIAEIQEKSIEKHLEQKGVNIFEAMNDIGVLLKTISDIINVPGENNLEEKIIEQTAVYIKSLCTTFKNATVREGKDRMEPIRNVVIDVDAMIEILEQNVSQ